MDQQLKNLGTHREERRERPSDAPATTRSHCRAGAKSDSEELEDEGNVDVQCCVLANAAALVENDKGFCLSDF